MKETIHFRRRLAPVARFFRRGLDRVRAWKFEHCDGVQIALCGVAAIILTGLVLFAVEMVRRAGP